MRLATGGLIDRNRKVSFSFNGRTMTAHPGDTLASALIANDVRLVGRSFKYHRPRGIFSAGSAEPNALMTIGEGADAFPNTRATQQEVFEGLTARSQNHLGRLDFDLLAINDLMSPFFGAGFYYKTFMRPKAFWERVYEPLIRRAAGLGKLPESPDQTRYDRAWAHCDLLVIGAGPTGLMAALTAARSGSRVILADEDFVFGGQLNAERQEIGGEAAEEWVRATVAELRSLPNVTLMPRTTVTGVYDHGTYGALQRVSEHVSDPGDAPKQTFWRIVTKRSVLAAGAIERPIAFRNNDRPGVMLAGAVRAYVNRFGAAPGKKVAIFTNNNDGWRTARDLIEAGVEIAALIDPRTDVAPGLNCPTLVGAEVVDTKGRLGLKEISVRTSGGNVERIEADCLAVSGGWNPAVHLSCHLGARPVWNEALAAFIPSPDAIPGMEAAGAAAGVFSTKGALKSGYFRARKSLEDMGFSVPSMQVPEAESDDPVLTPFWHVAGEGRAWLDLQNDVTVKDVKQAYNENFRSVEHMKRYTTLGMATDQGKTSNVGALAIMAELTGQSIPETGTTTFRPPYTPVPIGALGAHGTGKGFAPERFIPSHAAANEVGAEWLEAGQWYRPAWFPQPGETHWRQSCDREVAMVRNSVGICDVTTLGKIDIQGPDAAAFLDRVYAGTFSSLPVGKVRYGLMLREDGLVMDDGTTARLGETHYVMTTTTAAAGQVMNHLDFATQCLWPGLDVQFISVTEQWAQFAIAGPKAREVLGSITDTDVSNSALAFMGAVEAKIAGVAGRIFRISFSGELGFEVAVPARYGDALYRLLVEKAEALGGGAYGLEALNVLRLEKGFITHAEIHGRISADDIGMGRMVRPGSVGHCMSERPGITNPDREHLVGLRPVGSVKRILAGARMVAEGEEATRTKLQGYVSSSCYSPTLGHMIGLAFLRHGRERHGERIRAVDLLRGVDCLCEVVDPIQFDPDGGRMRG